MDDDFSPEDSVWPAFSDLLLSVVLVLILLIGMIEATQMVIDPKIPEKQDALIKEIAGPSSIILREKAALGTAVWKVRSASSQKPEVECRIDPQNPFLQRLAFADNVLFESDQTDLRPEGAALLARVGSAINKRLPSLAEIQINGHADPRATRRYRDNLELASLRANEVYRFLRMNVGLDPTKAVISAASFGEYMPTDRVREQTFSSEALQDANSTDAKRQQNRRIELLLFYRTRNSN